jgi:hypothetical protein
VPSPVLALTQPFQASDGSPSQQSAPGIQLRGTNRTGSTIACLYILYGFMSSTHSFIDRSNQAVTTREPGRPQNSQTQPSPNRNTTNQRVNETVNNPIGANKHCLSANANQPVNKQSTDQSTRPLHQQSRSRTMASRPVRLSIAGRCFLPMPLA